MATLHSLESARELKIRKSRAALVAGIEELLAEAKSGKIRGLCFSVLSDNTKEISFGVLRTSDCGMHEIVGSSALLNDFILRSCCSSE